MSAKKARDKDASSADGWGLPSGPTRHVVAVLLVVAVFAGGVAALWWWLGDRVLASPDYRLTLSQIEIPPQPSWIRADIRAEVFSGHLDGTLSIVDPELANRVASAFALHPWVAKVHAVRKHFPARVTVELEYRRPVCVVEQVVGEGVELRPVDVEGVVLPREEFSATALSQYPRLVNVRRSPVGPDGTCWGDPQVLGAAQIAAAFGDAWTSLGLDKIVAIPVENGPAEACNYELFTRQRTRILWGRGPEQPLANEFAPVDKVKQLQAIAAEQGSLNSLEQIDVRSQQSFRLIPRSPR